MFGNGPRVAPNNRPGERSFTRRERIIKGGTHQRPQIVGWVFNTDRCQRLLGLPHNGHQVVCGVR